MSKLKELVQEGKTLHYSVGAFVKKDRKYLLIDRAVPPLGFAGVAGHVDEGEIPEQALVREVEEEIGLKVVSYKLLFEELVDWNWCSKGVTGHYWHVFDCETSGEITQNFRETKSVGWYTEEEIKELKLEPVWDYWFKKLETIS